MNCSTRPGMRISSFFILALILSSLRFVFDVSGQISTKIFGPDADPQSATDKIFGWRLNPVESRNATSTDDDDLASVFTVAATALDKSIAAGTDGVASRREVERTTITNLEAYVSTHAESRWTPSLRNNMGAWYHLHGQVTKAMDHFESVWDATKVLEAGQGKKEADFALANWTRLLVLLGRTDLLQPVYEQYGNRELDRGPLSAMWIFTREKYVRIGKYPQNSFKCGIYALDKVATHLKLDYPQAELLNIPGKPQGFSLQELQDISAKYGFGLRAVKRAQESAVIPFPSVVHFSHEHYGAILSQRGEWYWVWDFANGGFVGLTAEEINSEATGYFLIQPASVGNEFQIVASNEAATIFGRASSCAPEINDDDGCSSSTTGAGSSGGGAGGGGKLGIAGGKMCSPLTGCSGGPGGGGAGGGGSSCDQCSDQNSDPSDDDNPFKDIVGLPPGFESTTSVGMPTWRVSEPYMSVMIDDTPLVYTPSKGPIVSLSLHYKLRESAGFFAEGV